MKLYRGFLEINFNLVCICKSNNFNYIEKKIKQACKELKCNGLISSLRGFNWYGTR